MAADSLTIVIPLYNESKRFVKGFKICTQYYHKNPNWFFIFINDGSLDQTEKNVNACIKKFKRMRLISYQKNQGKGYAIKQGVIQATTAYVMMTDIDFSTPLSTIFSFLDYKKSNSDITIGTRRIAGARVLKHQPYYREWLGHKFTQLTNIWLGLNFSDFTCGFKLFKSEVAKKIFSQQKVKRWGFDAEVLYLANKYHYRVKEIPVTWTNDTQTKVNLSLDVFRCLLELTQIRLNNWLGKYK